MKNSVGKILTNLRENKQVTEDELLLKLSDGNTIFEYAIKKGRKIKCDKFKKTKSLDIILEQEKYDLLLKCDLKTLLKVNRKNLNERYIETILKLFKYGNKINISIDPFEEGNSLNDVANIYIIYAKYDLVEYLPILGKNELLLKKVEGQKENIFSKIDALVFNENSKFSLLELLLNKSESLTVNKIVDENIQRDFDIAMILKTHNILKNNIEYDLKPNNFINNLLYKLNKKYDTILLRDEEQKLLSKLFFTFYGCSDIDALTTLINSYKIQLKKSNKNVIKEIKLLIELKESGSNLSFKIGESQYSIIDKTVEIQNKFIGVMNHEMSHALFHNLTDETIPPEFYEIIDKIRTNSSTLRKVYEYSESEKTNRKKLNKLIDEKYNQDFPLMNKLIELYKIRNTLKKGPNDILAKKELELSKLTYELRREIYAYLEQTKEEKKKIYLENGYSEKDLEVLFDNNFTIKDYARMHKKIQKREMFSIVNQTILSPNKCIGDIFDAIYKGNFISGKLYYRGNKIEPVSGHGLFYYNYDKRAIFDEILANYRTIMMSEYCEQYLEDLRYYVGDELVDFLDNYYNNVLLNSRAWENKMESGEERKKL